MTMVATRALLAASMLFALAGCGGGDAGSDSGAGTGASTSYSVTVTLTGLTASGLVLNNQGTLTSVPANSTSIVVVAGLTSGATYNVLPGGQPAGLSCLPSTAGSNAGTIASANVTIPYSCVPAFAVSGSIAGLTATGLQIRLFPDAAGATGAAYNVSPASGATSYTFPSQVRGDQTYSARIISQPTGLTCLFSNGTTDISGSMNGAAASAPIACTGPQPATYSLAVNFTALAGLAGITVQNNGGTGVAIPAQGTAVTIAAGLATGAAYTLTLSGVPAGFACGPVAAGSNIGTIAAANVTVAYSCAALHPVSVNVQSAAPAGLQLRLFPALGNTAAGFNLTPTTGGISAFGIQVRGDANYVVGIVAQPAGQTCVFGNSTVTVAGAMNNQPQSVNVQCNVTVGGTIAAALPGVLSSPLTGLTLSLDGGDFTDTLNIADGATAFTFATPLVSGNDYSVSIGGLPAGVSCTVALGKGIATTNVSNVAIRCMNNATDTLTGVYTVPPSVTGKGRYYFAFFAGGNYTFISRSDDSSCNFTNANGTFGGSGNGLEYGIYNYNATTGALAIKTAAIDTNGGCGMVDQSIADVNDPARYFSGTLGKSGGNATLSYLDIDTNQQVTLPLTAVPSTPSSIVGAFMPQTSNGQFAAFHPDSTTPTPVNIYVIPETQLTTNAAPPRQELGCYNLIGNQLTVSVATTCRPDGVSAYDFNGTSGLVESGTTGGPELVTISGINQIVLGNTVLLRIVPN